MKKTNFFPIFLIKLALLVLCCFPSKPVFAQTPKYNMYTYPGMQQGEVWLGNVSKTFYSKMDKDGYAVLVESAESASINMEEMRSFYPDLFQNMRCGYISYDKEGNIIPGFVPVFSKVLYDSPKYQAAREAKRRMEKAANKSAVD